MSEVERWSTYAGCWSAEPDERATTLAGVVADDVAYRDPGTEVAGRTALSGYMEGFRGGFAGHRFVIDHVDAHHDRSLARWRQVDGTGTTVMSGASIARHDDDGRLADITGFFLGAADVSGSREQAEHVCELLAPLGDVSLRRFFGGWALVDAEGQFGFVMDTLYLKASADSALLEELQREGSHPFTFVRSGREVVTSYWSVPDDALDDADALVGYARRLRERR